MFKTWKLNIEIPYIHMSPLLTTEYNGSILFGFEKLEWYIFKKPRSSKKTVEMFKARYSQWVCSFPTERSGEREGSNGIKTKKAIIFDRILSGSY